MLIEQRSKIQCETECGQVAARSAMLKRQQIRLVNFLEANGNSISG